MAELGVIVVGIGTAGKVRCRDIGRSSEYMCNFPELQGVRLKGYCSRRDIDVEGVSKSNLEEALSRSDYHCVVICTENDTHVDTARKAIEAGKHVLVEFPLAPTFQVGKALFEMAHSKGVILHEENILLLSDGMKAILSAAKEKTVIRARVSLTAKFSSSTPGMLQGGPIFSHRIHFLHCLLLCCGTLQAVSASVTFKDAGEGQRNLEVIASLRGKESEIEMKLNFSHDPNTAWSSFYEFEFSDGTVMTSPPAERPKPPQPPVPGLFMKDFISFIKRIKGTGEPYLPEETSLEALRLADHLEILAKKEAL